MKITKTVGIIALTLTIFATILSGCSFNRWVEVAGGDYLPVVSSGLHQGAGASLIESMNVDRNKNTVNIHLKDGAEINADFEMRPKQDSPLGCPSNINATKMEVLELDVDKLTIGSVVINSPVLVRTCPRNPEVVIPKGASDKDYEVRLHHRKSVKRGKPVLDATLTPIKNIER